MVRGLNREREKQRDKIKYFFYNQLQDYKIKLHNDIREKSNKLWKIRHDGPIQEELTNNLEIELDVLNDVYRNIESIK